MTGIERATTTLKYTKSVIYLPNLKRSGPTLTERDREKAAMSPPEVAPQHCKPWLDGQKAGYVVRYGYFTPITIWRDDDGKIVIDNWEKLFSEAKVINMISQFAEHHFGMLTGYTISTEPGMVTLMMPSTNPPANLEPLTGVIESDWFPRELFVPIKMPAKGEKIHLEYECELARIMVVPRPQHVSAELMTEEEQATITERAADYRKNELTTDNDWVAADGTRFTHLYKQYSRDYDKELKREHDVKRDESAE